MFNNIDMDHVIKMFENTIEKNINKSHKAKLIEIIKSFYSNKDKNVFSLELGFGKTTIIQEFIKYMIDIDKNFSCVVVKKSLDEAEEFRKAIGIKNSEIIKGFNTNDCKKRLVIGSIKDKYKEYNQYQPDICMYCKEKCKVKSIEYKNKQVVIITHQRLFMSTYHETLKDDILYYYDSNNNKIKRNFLIIDEKFDLIDNGSITEIDINNILDILKLKLVNVEFEKFLKKIESKCPRTFNEKPVSIKRYDKNFMFDEKIKNLYLNNLKYTEDIIKLEKFLRWGGTISRAYITNCIQFNYCRAIDFKNIAKEFSSHIILDATSKIDKEYNSEKIKKFKDKRLKINLYHNSDLKLSKYNISSDYENNTKVLSYELANIINIYNKTLIISYNNIKNIETGITYNLIDDLDINLYNLCESKYTILSHATKIGSNEFQDYDCIIIIGNLNKGNNFYENRAYTLNEYILENKKINASQIKDNEYLINAIQHIGRINVRQDKVGNVYLLGTSNNVINGIEDYFKIIKNEKFSFNNNIFEDKRKSKKSFSNILLEYLNEIFKNADYVLLEDICVKFNKSDKQIRKAMESKRFKNKNIILNKKKIRLKT